MPIGEHYAQHNGHFDHDHGSSKVKKLLASVSSSFIPRKISFSKASIPDNAGPKPNPINKVTITPVRDASNKSIALKDKEVVNEDGFQEPAKVLFPKKRVNDIMGWERSTNAGAGLHNHGNTCFLNSVVQCLTHTPPLANYLLSREHSRSCKIIGLCMMCVLEKQVAKALSNGGAISPGEIVQNIRKIAPGFRPGRQEDAHEFLRFVLESAQKSCLYPLKDDKSITPREAQTTVIGNIFGGYLQSQVKCSECHYESNTYDPFMDLCVDLGTGVDSVSAALKKFVKPEILDARNMYMCSKCKRRVRASKRMRVYQAPPILTIQLKRFSFFQMYGGKINRSIEFDQQLDLEPYMCKPSAEGPILYNLYGVLVHAGGSTNSGHYYSFVKGPNGDWYLMDDSSVSKVSLKTVLQQRAYILFYARVQSRASTPNRSRPTTPTADTPSLTTSTSLSTSASTSTLTPPSTPHASHSLSKSLTTPTSNQKNGMPRDPHSKTYGTDPNEKTMNGKAPLLMSNTPQLQPQQRQANQSRPQQLPTSTVSPSSNPKHLDSLPKSPSHLKSGTTLPSVTAQSSTYHLPSLSQSNPSQQPLPTAHSANASSHALDASSRTTHGQAQNGKGKTGTEVKGNGKRKEREEEINESPRKLRRVDSDWQVRCFGGRWRVKDVMEESEERLLLEGEGESERTEETHTEMTKEQKKKEKQEKKRAKKEAQKRAKEEKAKADKTKDGNSIWKGLFGNHSSKSERAEEPENSNIPSQNGKSHTNSQNGKSHANGTLTAENGKSNRGGKPNENGKHENGKPHENGKSHSENGKSNFANGKSHFENGNGKPHFENGNGKSHLENGKSNFESGKSRVESEKPRENGQLPAENGKHAMGNGATENGHAHSRKAANDRAARDFLNKMATSPSSWLGGEVDAWDDVEDAAGAVEERKKKGINQNQNGKLPRMFQQRDEWDVEYDMGRSKKLKKKDLFTSMDNKFQFAAEERIKQKEMGIAQ